MMESLADESARSALSEISIYSPTIVNFSPPDEVDESPDAANIDAPTNIRISGSPASPDELIIQKRGPRRIPITWSPIDIQKMVSKDSVDKRNNNLTTPPKSFRRSIKKLRLFLTPEKNPSRNLFDEFNDTKRCKLNVTAP